MKRGDSMTSGDIVKRTAAGVTALCLALCLAGCGKSGGSTNDGPDTTDRPSAEEPVGGAGEQSGGEAQGEGAEEIPSGGEEQGEGAGEIPSGVEKQAEEAGEVPSGGEEQGEGAEEIPSSGEKQAESGPEVASGEETSGENPGGDGQAELQEEYVVPSDSDIIRAITAYNHEMFPDAEFEAASYVVYATGGVRDDDSIITVYLMALYQGYDFPDGRPEMVCAVSGPAALTFRNTDDGFQLTEYWTPEDGGEYMPSLREKFPHTIPEEDFDTQKYIQRLTEDCDAQAEAYAQNR